MAAFIPLPLLRYDISRVNLLPEWTAAPPSEVLTPDMRDMLAAKSPYNAVHVDLPEGYGHARELLDAWQENGVLMREAPAVYLMSTSYDGEGDAGAGRVRWGVLGGLGLAEYNEGVVLPHERTFQTGMRDRMELLQAAGAELSPVFMLFSDEALTLTRLGEVRAEVPPLVTYDQGNGVTHRVWRLDEEETRAVQRLLDPQQVVIADGHHRYEAALAERRRLGAGTPGDERPWDYVFAYLCNTASPGVEILATHRLVTWYRRFDWEAILERSAERFELAPVADASLLAAAPEGSFVLVLPSGMWLLSLKGAPGALPDTAAALCRRVDACAVHREFLRESAGLTEEDLDSEEYLSYTVRAEEVLELVEGGAAQAGILVRPASREAVLTAAASGLILPRKTTFFRPKLPSGLFYYRFA